VLLVMSLLEDDSQFSTARSANRDALALRFGGSRSLKATAPSVSLMLKHKGTRFALWVALVFNELNTYYTRTSGDAECYGEFFFI
jgi:hypothetical protein